MRRERRDFRLIVATSNRIAWNRVARVARVATTDAMRAMRCDASDAIFG
jgi:hypothetical protein